MNKKPIKWYYHKCLCEFGWFIRDLAGEKYYYKHLHKLCKTGFNLYGDRLK